MPALTAGIENQGLAYYLPRKDATILKNVISVSANGANTGSMFYQPNEFTVLQDSYAIQFKNKKLSSEEYLYFLTTLRKTIGNRYDWSSKAGWNRIKNEEIMVPYYSDTIDFSYMKKYIYEFEVGQIEKLHDYFINHKLNDCKLTIKETKALEKYYSILNQSNEKDDGIELKYFNLNELFGNATRGKRLKSADRKPGKLPFVTAGELDMGVSDYIDNNVDVFSQNTITIDMFGSAKYRNYRYGADDHVAVVHTNHLNKYTVLFLTAAINKSSNTGVFDFSRNFYAKDADCLNISLPSINGKPDYDYMATLLKAIEKNILKSVIEYTQSKFDMYKSEFKCSYN